MNEKHVSDFDFGYGIDADAFIEKILALLPKMAPVEIRMVLGDLYETEFGIYNHNAKVGSRPLSTVAFHPSEDPNEGSLLEDLAARYIRRGIKDIWDMSLTEYMNNPMDFNTMLDTVAEREIKKAPPLPPIPP